MDSQTRRAAVIVLIKNMNGQDNILLTKRASSLRLHSGEIALPGGKHDKTDSNLCATAIREAYEEVNVDPCHVNIIKALDPSYSRTNMFVKPFVATLRTAVNVRANPDEVDEIFWVPVSFFEADQRLRTDILSINGEECWAPVYEFSGHVIWGLTARIIVDMMNVCYSANIEQYNAAPEKNIFGDTLPLVDPMISHPTSGCL